MLKWLDEFLLGYESIDESHHAFLELVSQAGSAEGEQFKSLFNEINEHLIKHFFEEEVLMDSCQFSASAEHKGEHRRILGEMNQFKRQIDRGRTQMAKAYVTDNLPQWFTLHIGTMDSALVATLNKEKLRA